MKIINWLKDQFTKLEKYEYQPLTSVEVKAENTYQENRKTAQEERKIKDIRKKREETVKRAQMVSKYFSENMKLQDIPARYQWDSKFLYEILLKDDTVLTVIPDAIKLSFIKYAAQRGGFNLEFNDSLNQKYNDCVALYKIITNQIQCTSQLDSKYIKDKEVVRELVRKDEFNWNLFDASIKQDRAMIFQSLRSNIHVYKRLDDEYKNDVNIVGFMMSQDKSYYHWLPEEKRHRMKYVKKMLSEDSAYISLIPEDLRANKEVITLLKKFDTNSLDEPVKRIKPR